MENNEVSMVMDVKLDINERRVAAMRSWTKCCVKIEAIKCFPCYVKITLTKVPAEHNEDVKDLTVKINIPGLTVEMATSRTKHYSYGLFWKNNRKKCSIFLALDSQLSCESHMKWMKKSIFNLELHRRENLETRQLSKNNHLDESGTSVLSNFNSTQMIRDINDILGPLPELPDSNINWSRRISGFSGIYEEIPDGDSEKIIHRKSSRVSIESGIYEVMQSPLNAIREIPPTPPTPPPLPPRSRSSTLQSEFSRCYTNPESDAFKSRSAMFLDNVLWRYKRSDSVGSECKFINDKIGSIQSRAMYFYDIDNKRNSFSSPDLTKSNHYENGSCSSGFCSYDSGTVTKSNNLMSTDSISSNKYLQTENVPKLNIASINESPKDKEYLPKFKSHFFDDLSGYCKMVPVIPNIDQVNDLPVVAAIPEANVKKKTLNNNAIKTVASELSQPNYDFDVKKLSDNFQRTFSTKDRCEKENDFLHSVVDCDGNKEDNCIPDTALNNISKQNGQLSENFETIIYSNGCNSSNCSRTEVDKYPSYYPNTSVGSEKSSSNKRRAIFNSKSSKRTENVYIKSPLNMKPEASPSVQIVKYSETNTELTPSIGLSNTSAFKIERQISDISPIDHQSTKNTPKLYQKYATLARLTPTRYSADKNVKKTDFGSSMKRFASLPRFRKIDFSPLKMKINNVLNRQNSDF